MILQYDRNLDPGLRKMGCEYLSLLAAVELETSMCIRPSEANDLWAALVDQGMVNSNNGLFLPGSYRSALSQALARNGRPSWIGDMVADVIDGKVSFYGWWHSTTFDYVLERKLLLNGTQHTILRDYRFHVIYNSCPLLSTGTHVSFHLLWIGARSEWAKATV